MKYVSVIRGFDNAPAAYYRGPAATAPGAAAMTAAVMFYLRDEILNGATQTLWHNLDQALNRGWGIFLEGTIQDGHIMLTTALGDGVGQNAIQTDLGPGPIGKLSLVHLVADNNERRVYYNGSLIAVEALANPVLGSALQPTVGELVGVGAPASGVDIVGVGYYAGALGSSGPAAHFRACARSGNFSYIDQNLPAVFDWTNRWDAREGAVVLGNQGALAANGDLAALPAASASWAPSAGAAALTLTGALSATVLTDLPWGYTSGEVGGGAANTFELTFVDADLGVGNLLTVTHNLNSNPVSVSIVDNNGAVIIPDAITVITANQITIDFTSFVPIVGTWRVLVVGR